MSTLNYILGLDLGIASVGWAVIEIDREENPINLVDLGVRTFEKAEVAKTGESLALSRRLARSSRRLIYRRAQRIKKAKRLLTQFGVLQPNINKQSSLRLLPNNTWQLRVAGLDRKLNNAEWAAVLLHLVKHRGYLSQRKNESLAENKELGALLSGIKKNHSLLQANKYRSPAELAIKEFAENEGHIRNQRGHYNHTFDRLDLKAELQLLFKQQRLFQNPYSSEEFENSFIGLLMAQKAAISGEAILKMLGKCTYETAEYKLAKNTYSAERFIWISKLNNLRILKEGNSRSLTDSERRKIIEQPYIKAKLTYAQVRKILELNDSEKFNLVRYTKDNAENDTLIEIKSFHTIRKALEIAGLKTEWEGLKTKPELLDKIGIAFSVYKTDIDISTYLSGKIADNILSVLLEKLHFDKFIELSLLCIKKILPLMEHQGLRYDEACKQIYGDHYGQKNIEENLFLPKFSANDIRNPVVLRTLSQTRKIINAVVRKYGSPAYVHIETGREVGKSYKDRRDIEKRQEANREDRKRAVNNFKNLFPNFGEPKAQDILKLRLYEQQQGKCLYSEKPLDLNRLFEKGYVEIDHALPFSRTWDDSFNNKVLVLAAENQNKKDKTPYEWFDGASNSHKWKMFVALVNGCSFSYAKKNRLLTQKLDDSGFIERNLNDTRYITRFLCQYIEEKMKLVGQHTRKVFASNGQITALLRTRWGLKKVRSDNDRHHALDAIVVACSTRSMQKRITDFVRRKELNPFNGEYVNYSTGEIKHIYFPEPWEYFRNEVLIRVFSNNPKEELIIQLPSRPQAVHDLVAPLFVSRMPTRKMTGQGHKETIKSAKRLDERVSITKVPLTQLKLNQLDNMVNREREKDLYESLKRRLEKFENEPQKAFAEPFYKKGGQQVKSIRIEDVQKSGVLVHNGTGIADNASMVRIDVFTKNKKYFLVPIYTWQVAKGILPNRAVIANKDENNWEEMDKLAEFQFSLYPNDLVKVKTKKDEFFGYYSGLDRATGAISIKEHDNEKSKGKDGLYRGIGVKSAIIFEKYQIDELGKNIKLCKKTKRQNVR